MNQNALADNRTRSTPIGLTMRAVEYDQYGDADVLHAADHPVPQRLPGQLMIEVLASSVNPIDYRFRHGDMKGFIVILRVKTSHLFASQNQPFFNWLLMIAVGRFVAAECLVLQLQKLTD